MKINLFCDDYDFKPLEKALEGEAEGDDLAAEIIICDEEEIARLNSRFRDKNEVTDVLSFPSLDGVKGKALYKKDFPADLDEDGNIFIGSIAICMSRALEQADEYLHSPEREINYLAAHGVCHLLGYDHITDADKREMRVKEENIMRKMNLSEGQ